MKLSFRLRLHITCSISCSVFSISKLVIDLVAVAGLGGFSTFSYVQLGSRMHHCIAVCHLPIQQVEASCYRNHLRVMNVKLTGTSALVAKVAKRGLSFRPSRIVILKPCCASVR
jgi:hypothetical protein